MANVNETKPGAAFFAQIKNPVKLRLFLFKKLPAAFFSGLKITEANEQKCVVSVPYKWFTQNPFRSTYFACLSMAAELSTGVLAMASIYKRKPSVSMLIVHMESSFFKKAVGLTLFVCEQGQEISDAVERAVATGQPQTIKVKSTGFNPQNEVVAECCFTWSFKAKG
ncbi:MAG TPA: DUF4442 domain-containing protein [Flavisolibacter sp.]|jgi:hypothetical protein|nr:DUF4442 domain-containing protein [Flavisolibacter sp.]